MKPDPVSGSQPEAGFRPLGTAQRERSSCRRESAPALAVLVTTAISGWPATCRFAVACAALSFPVAAALILYVLIR